MELILNKDKIIPRINPIIPAKMTILSVTYIPSNINGMEGMNCAKSKFIHYPSSLYNFKDAQKQLGFRTSFVFTYSSPPNHFTTNSCSSPFSFIACNSLLNCSVSSLFFGNAIAEPASSGSSLIVKPFRSFSFSK